MPMCACGYSANWVSEYSSPRGTQPGQVVGQWSSDGYYGDTSWPHKKDHNSCRSACTGMGAPVWEGGDASGSCRCYSKAQADAMSISSSGMSCTGSSGTICANHTTNPAFTIKFHEVSKSATGLSCTHPPAVITAIPRRLPQERVARAMCMFTWCVHS